MTATLTPFPDGIGYLEHAWNGMSEVQKELLMERAGHIPPIKRAPRSATWQVLMDKELLDGDGAVTDRGRDLAAWVNAAKHAS